MTQFRPGPRKQVWRSLAQTKVKYFSWLVVRRACLTHEVLQKRKFHIASRCFLCCEKRDKQPLFLHCKFTAQLQSLVFNKARMKWLMPEHTADLLSCWTRRGDTKSQRKWWSIIPPCLWWTISPERNGRCFEDRINSIQKAKDSFIASLYFWCKQSCIDEDVKLVDF